MGSQHGEDGRADSLAAPNLGRTLPPMLSQPLFRLDLGVSQELKEGEEGRGERTGKTP